MRRIPVILIFSRLFLGFIILIYSFYPTDNYKNIVVALLITGLLTDVFDGIIARKLNISSVKLRRLDSGVDQIFFLSVVAATFIHCPTFYLDNWLKLSLLILFEGVTYLICFLKFKKEVATHTIGAKFWSLLLLATLIQLMIQCNSRSLFESCFWIGLLTRVEIIAIILTLKVWTNDVPSYYHALKLRKGESIKRHKLFNG